MPSGLRHAWVVIGTGTALFAVTVMLYAAVWWAVSRLWGHIAVWLGWA